MRRLYSLLLLIAVLAFGGSSIGTRTLEIVETEGEGQVRLATTHARRHVVHLAHLPEYRVVEAELDFDRHGSPCRARRDPSDPKNVECQYLGPPRPSRAPPAAA